MPVIHIEDVIEFLEKKIEENKDKPDVVKVLIEIKEALEKAAKEVIYPVV